MLIQEPKIVKLRGLNEPVDYYGKTWIVCTLSKEDLEDKLTKKQFAKLTDSDLASLADNLADALFDTAYWECLDVLLDDYRK